MCTEKDKEEMLWQIEQFYQRDRATTDKLFADVQERLKKVENNNAKIIDIVNSIYDTMLKVIKINKDDIL